MELKKYHTSEILHIIRHNARALPDGTYGNGSIVPELKAQNENLINRGRTPEEINNYRKNLEKEIFHYNRKNLVHAVNVIIQCPDDCPPEEENAFFKVCYDFWCNRLPMGERCIIQAVIHRDEIVMNEAGQRISHNHMHLSFVPAVPDTKHEGFAYKLNADQLTKKSVLKTLHPALQEKIDAAGLHATVYRKRSGDARALKLSVADLKKITELTGKSICDTITVADFAELINTAFESRDTIQKLAEELSQKNSEIEKLITEKLNHEKEISELKNDLTETRKSFEDLQKEKEDFKKQLDMQPQKTTKRMFSWSNRSQTQNIEKEQEIHV